MDKEHILKIFDLYVENQNYQSIKDSACELKSLLEDDSKKQEFKSQLIKEISRINFEFLKSSTNDSNNNTIPSILYSYLYNLENIKRNYF